MMPHRLTQHVAISVGLLMALLLPISLGFGKHKKTEAPPFEYVAGTENVEKGCGGKLEVLKEGFTFKCPGASINLPFATITLMQYRPDLSEEVLAMKIPWNSKPLLARVRDNKYFTVVCNEQGKLRAVVLRVDENDMRPYFAEIELQSGKSVQEYRSFEEFN
jgi:hypothetical protein